MRILHALALAATLAAAPLAFAHDNGIGAPKGWCETPADVHIHEYATTVWPLWVISADGSVGPCGGGGLQDGHAEYGFAGTYLLGCASACGMWGLGEGSLACHGAPPDHAPLTPIKVVDAALTPAGVGVRFTVIADMGPNCGDFDADMAMECVDVCTPFFGPGASGAYEVLVEGTTGHVYN